MSIFGGGNSGANAAKKAQKTQAKADAQRIADITTGAANINTAFKGFDPTYYSSYDNAILGTQLPQLNTQFANAKQRVLFDLSNRGLIKSSTAGKQQGDLATEYSTGQATVKSQAQQATDTLRTSVENMRQSLLAQNSLAADPTLAASGAASAADSLKAQQAPVSSLGNMFAELAAPAATYIQLRNNAQLYGGGGGGGGLPNIGPATPQWKAVA